MTACVFLCRDNGKKKRDFQETNSLKIPLSLKLHFDKQIEAAYLTMTIILDLTTPLAFKR